MGVSVIYTVAYIIAASRAQCFSNKHTGNVVLFALQTNHLDSVLNIAINPEPCAALAWMKWAALGSVHGRPGSSPGPEDAQWWGTCWGPGRPLRGCRQQPPSSWAVCEVRVAGLGVPMARGHPKAASQWRWWEGQEVVPDAQNHGSYSARPRQHPPFPPTSRPLPVQATTPSPPNLPWG